MAPIGKFWVGIQDVIFEIPVLQGALLQLIYHTNNITRTRVVLKRVGGSFVHFRETPCLRRVTLPVGAVPYEHFPHNAVISRLKKRFHWRSTSYRKCDVPMVVLVPNAPRFVRPRRCMAAVDISMMYQSGTPLTTAVTYLFLRADVSMTVTGSIASE